MKSRIFTPALLVGMLVGAIIGCGSSSTQGDAGTGVSLAQFQSFQAQVSNQIKQLKFVAVQKGGSASLSVARTESVARPQQVANPCANLGTIVSQSPFDGNVEVVQSCTGYYGEFNQSDGTWLGTPMLWFDAPNCTGNIYVGQSDDPTQGATAALISNGVIYQYQGVTYVLTAKETAVSVNVQSVFLNGKTCSPATQTSPLYALIPNAGGTVSGEPDGPVAVPVTAQAPTG